jgi:hypothetical protein
MIMSNTEKSLASDNDGQPMWKFLLGELKPRGKFLTPFNIISIPVMILGLVLIRSNNKSDSGCSMGLMDRI